MALISPPRSVFVGADRPDQPAQGLFFHTTLPAGFFKICYNDSNVFCIFNKKREVPLLITGELKNKIDKLWTMFWTGGITNPLDVIEQITYLMFIHELDEIDTEKSASSIMLKLPYTSIFDADHQDCRWSQFKNYPAQQMYTTVQERVFPFIKGLHGDEESAYSKYMADAIFKIPTPQLLEQIVTAMDEIDWKNSDIRGDLYEYLLSKIATAGTNGQFRTPRHIIKMMVNLVEPKVEDIICEKKKFFHFLTQYGSKESIYDLEQHLWDFLDAHFTEKEWLPKKKAYWEKLDNQIPRDSNKSSYFSYKHEHIRGYLIQIKIDEGATLKEAEQLLQSLDSSDRDHRLARLYRVRNEVEKEQVLLEKALKNPYESYYRNEYQERLLQLYQQNNELEKAKKLLKSILLKDPEDLSAFRAYRECFSPEEWKTVLSKELFPALKANKTALPLFAKENRYDLVMAACEACGELPSKWERKLQKQYPQRCLALLQKQVTNLAERAYNRKGYQWVARLLRRTAKYDGGILARQLISQFKQQYANRPAFMEELNWEFPRID